MAARSKKLREAKMDERGEGEGRRARSRLVWGGDRLSDEQVATTESKEAIAVTAAIERWEDEGGSRFEIRPRTSPRSLR